MSTLSQTILKAQENARQLRVNYEAHLQRHQASAIELLETAWKLAEQDRRLAAVVKDAERLRAELAALPEEEDLPEVAVLEATGLADAGARTEDRRQMRRTVSFATEEEQRHFSVAPVGGDLPVHGHWLPEETAQRTSFQDPGAKQLGGRKVTLQTGKQLLGPVACILVEPMGKVLSPTEYVGTGVVLFLQATGPSGQGAGLEEWGQVLRQTKLLDAGLSVLLPAQPLPASTRAAELEGLVEAALEMLDARRCLVFGKAQGALLALALAADSRLAEAGRLAGVVLAAPEASEKAFRACGEVQVPSLVLGTKGDAAAQAWARALRRPGGVGPPAAARFCAVATTSGRDLGRLLRKDREAATTVLHFCAAALLAVDLAVAAEAHEEPQLLECTLRLCDELPSHLEGQFAPQSTGSSHGLASAVVAECAEVGTRTAALRLLALLRAWLIAGLAAAQPARAGGIASATE